ncbi:dephospho-CoA kinase [Tropheryma whipplei]|uniref:dephospho-CoA kinase n=1 Tax=Tropheryma whipplei TaxID=2039 RepID=UPI0004B028AD|nr:dephospho-CoA kinase [Tropheryma whipplei]
MQLFALTGGIAAGKSCVAGLLSEFGLRVVSADSLVEVLYRTDVRLIEEIKGRFLCNDEKSLSELVFSDSRARRVLNQLTHQRVNRLALDYFWQLRNEPVVIYEIPILESTSPFVGFAPGECGVFASGKIQHSGVLFVHSDCESRIDRLMKRNNLNRIQALQRIHSQTPYMPQYSLRAGDLLRTGGLLRTGDLSHDFREERAPHKGVKVYSVHTSGVSKTLCMIQNTSDFSHLRQCVASVFQIMKTIDRSV